MAMRRLLPMLLLVAACSARDIEEPGQSHRHLAAEYCEEWCTFWHACEPLLAEVPVEDCRESCESDEAWDWTDHCGDLKWAFRECMSSLSCEEARDDPDVPGTDNPCQEHFNEFVIQQCRYDRPHGG